MIFTVIFNFLYIIVTGIIGLLPIIPLPQPIIDGINTVIYLINTMNIILPTDTMWQVLSIYLIMHLTIFGWKAAHWAYALLRGHRILK